jgi:uncharacterized protein (UPF0335 family)
MTGTGHNSISAQALDGYVKRIERLKEERAALAEDERQVFTEAKSLGFDPKIMREVIKLRAMDPSDLAERKAMIELYMDALGAKL